jgi:hypothetical protein
VALDAAAVMANLITVFDTTIPGLGSVLGAVLGGWSVGRRLQRVVAAVDQLRWDLEETRGGLSEVQRSYLRSEQFEEVLEGTLRRVSIEPSDEKRRLYGAFLRCLVRNPSAWDEARLTSSLLAQIDMPGLVLVATFSKNPDNRSTLSSRPATRVYDADVPVASIIERPEDVGTYHEIPFSWPVGQVGDDLEYRVCYREAHVLLEAGAPCTRTSPRTRVPYADDGSSTLRRSRVTRNCTAWCEELLVTVLRRGARRPRASAVGSVVGSVVRVPWGVSSSLEYTRHEPSGS